MKGKPKLSEPIANEKPSKCSSIDLIMILKKLYCIEMNGGTPFDHFYLQGIHLDICHPQDSLIHTRECPN